MKTEVGCCGETAQRGLLTTCSVFIIEIMVMIMISYYHRH